MAIQELSEKDFQDFVDKLDLCYFEQSINMAKLLTKRGYQTERIGLKDDKGNIVVAGILFKQKIFGGTKADMHYGPAYSTSKDLEHFLLQLKDYVKQSDILELKIQPYDTYQTYDDQGKPTGPANETLIQLFESCGYHFTGLTKGYETGDWHYVKDMKDLDAKTLPKSYSKKGQTLLKKVKSFGITVRKLEKSELKLFKDITSATSERRGYTDKPLDYYEKFYDSFGDKAEFMLASLNFQDYHDRLLKEKEDKTAELTQLHISYKDNSNSAKYHRLDREINLQLTSLQDRLDEAQTFIHLYGNQDVPLAASLFIFTPQEVFYLYSGSLTEFNKFYAPVLLQDYALNQAVQRHIPSYNFLAFSGDFDGSDGVLRFKQNFNGYVRRNVGAFIHLPKPLKYKLIQGFKAVVYRLTNRKAHS